MQVLGSDYQSRVHEPDVFLLLSPFQPQAKQPNLKKMGSSLRDTSARKGVSMSTRLLASFAGLLVASCALPAYGISPSPQAASKRPLHACAPYHSLPDVATIMAATNASFRSYHKRHLRRDDVVKLANDSDVSRRALVPGWNCTTSAIPTSGDVDNGSNGVLVTNADTKWRAFFLYHNSCDDIPWKYIWIGPGATRFVSLPALFEGRIVRGNDKVSLS